MSRRLRIALIALSLLGSVALIAGPPLLARAVRVRLTERVAARLGAAITVDEVRASWGTVALRGLSIRLPELPAPLSVARVRARFLLAPLVAGRLEVTDVEVSGVRVAVVHAPGYDNVSSLIENLRRPRAGGGGGGSSLRVEKVRISDVEVALVDERGEVTIGALEGALHPDGPAELRLRDVVARLASREVSVDGVPTRTEGGQQLTLPSVMVHMQLAHGRPVGIPTIELDNGSAQISRNFTLTGISGRIEPSEGRAAVDIHGSYGGAQAELWNVRGSVDPVALTGELRLRAARFRLSQLGSVLERPEAVVRILHPEEAEVDARMDVTLGGGKVVFTGAGHLAGLTLAHPGLAPLPVSRLGFDARFHGSYDIAAKRLSLDELALDHANVHATLTALVDRGGASGPTPGRPGGTARRYAATVKVKPVPCQAVLAAIPTELVPRLQGFKLAGTFSTDLSFGVSWVPAPPPTPGKPAPPPTPDGLVPEVELGGKVGIEGCKVTEPAQALDAARLLGPFEQTVQYEPGKWRSFVVGADNPDWTPYADISPHLINSITGSEDFNFFKHRGFIASEFRSALQQNLMRGYFRLGASSITMQMVKNVLLSREKTLSRKLQELFLTWYVEKQLGKERILEIYFNAIEFGPNIYGIGAATRHYFGKSPKDLLPEEAAFFSSILPNPKKRYVQFCHATGTVDAKWDAYIKRILRKNHERQRLTDAEFEKAIAKPLEFDRKEAMPERDCLALVKRLTTPTVPPPAK